MLGFYVYSFVLYICSYLVYLMVYAVPMVYFSYIGLLVDWNSISYTGIFSVLGKEQFES